MRGLLAAVAIVTIATALPHTQSLAVDEIVARNLAAKGGAEKLRAVTSVKSVGTVRNPRGETPVSSWAKRPNMIRREQVTEGQTFVIGFDGKTVWGINPLISARAREISGPQAEMTKQDADDFDTLLLDYKTKGHTVELVGTESLQGKSVHRLRVTKKSGAIQELYLDADTFLESKIVMQLDQGGRKAIVTMEFSNYKDVDGIKVPFHIKQSLNGQVMTEVTYGQVQFNEDMPDSLFKMPSAI
jgi:outer membrane lipoprotein-sorting protein